MLNWMLNWIDLEMNWRVDDKGGTIFSGKVADGADIGGYRRVFDVTALLTSLSKQCWD